MSDIYQPNPQQQLQLLKEQTRLTGGLHEAQVLQLKLWPLVVFDTAISSSFTWDPDKKTVSFKIIHPATKAKKKPGLAWWKERVMVLNRWVQALLGDEWMIYLICGNKTYSGQRTYNVGAERNRPVTD
jgi:hypothetical protein